MTSYIDGFCYLKRTTNKTVAGFVWAGEVRATLGAAWACRIDGTASMADPSSFTTSEAIHENKRQCNVYVCTQWIGWN
jgi:hypothetical protein